MASVTVSPFAAISPLWHAGLISWDGAIIHWTKYRAALQRCQFEPQFCLSFWVRYNALHSKGRWIIHFKPLPYVAFWHDWWLKKYNYECDSSFNAARNSVKWSMAPLLFNQNPSICCNFPSFPPGEREKVGHAGSEEGRKENCSKWWDFDWTAEHWTLNPVCHDGEIAANGPSLTDAIFSLTDPSCCPPYICVLTIRNCTWLCPDPVALLVGHVDGISQPNELRRQKLSESPYCRTIPWR